MVKAGFLYRRAQLRGLLGGSRPWLVLWVVMATWRVLRRLTRDTPEIAFREELHDGETLVISAVDRVPRVLGARS